jgi:hypothetical protein
VVDDLVVGFKDAVREIVAHELPDVFLQVQLRALCRRWDNRNVGRHGQAAGEMPGCLIDEERSMTAWRDLGGDFGKMQVHRLGVAPRR